MNEIEIDAKELPQYKFLEYNLLSALKNDELWTQFMEAIAEELYLERCKISETKNFFGINQLRDGFLRNCEMFGYIPNLRTSYFMTDEEIELFLKREYESVPFRIRNKTTYDGYKIIFRQIGQLGEIYNYYWNNEKFIRAIEFDNIIENLNEGIYSYNEPITVIPPSENFSVTSLLNLVNLDEGHYLDEIIGNKSWNLDTNAQTRPTKHLGLEYHADELFVKNEKEYLITSEFFDYLSQSAHYNKRCPVITHEGVQISSILTESNAYDSFNIGEDYTINKIKLKSCCGFEYMKGFVTRDKFFLDEDPAKKLDSAIKWRLDETLESITRPSMNKMYYISCGNDSLSIPNKKNEGLFNYLNFVLYYSFNDSDNVSTIRDYSSNETHGEIFGETTKKSRGIIGKSVTWDGTNYVKGDIIMYDESFTLNVWIKPNSLYSNKEFCIFDLDFFKMYYNYENELVSLIFNDETIQISCPKNEIYNFMFEFDLDESKIKIFKNGTKIDDEFTIDSSIAGDYTIYIGTDSNIDDDDDNPKFIGIIDDFFIKNGFYSDDQKKYIVDNKLGILTHIGNRLSSHKLGEDEYVESSKWRMVSSQVSCNNINDEFAFKVDDTLIYKGTVNFNNIKTNTFSFNYIKNYGSEVGTLTTIKADENGNFYIDEEITEEVINEATREREIIRYMKRKMYDGYIDYESGDYEIRKLTERINLNSKVTQNELLHYNTNRHIKEETIHIVINGLNYRFTLTDKNGVIEGGSDEISGTVNYDVGLIELVFDSSLEITDDIDVSYTWYDDLRMEEGTDVYMDYKIESSEETNITELAIEDEDHNVLLYMTFPPVQASDYYNYITANFMIQKLQISTN